MPKAAIQDGILVQADTYHWTPGSRIKADIDKAVIELKAIYQQRGAVTPAEVVASAKRKTSALHNEFEWGDGEAARLYREEQARHLLRSLVVVYKKPDGTRTIPHRAFVKIVPSADDPALDQATADTLKPHVYLPVKTVMTEVDLRERHKRQAWRDLVSWRQRYRDVVEFSKVFEQIEALKAEFDTAG